MPEPLPEDDGEELSQTLVPEAAAKPELKQPEPLNSEPPAPAVPAAAQDGPVRDVPPPDADNPGQPATPLSPADRPTMPVHPLPQAYRLRTAENRSQVVQQHGGSPETEAAVKAALDWLAKNQDPDGRWNPRTHGGGVEMNVAGRDRQGAGSRADTGMTGLALLAFLAAGHTHREGGHRKTVNAGLDYLLGIQAADGNLGGDAAVYESMYCHGMATIALAEAFGMTGDPRLEGPVRRATMYTVAAQNPLTGGWRYRPGDPGDTSQMGWQLLALKSAELAGIPVPAEVWRRAGRFLGSVSHGAWQGLAAYRPGEHVSRPMTAEALVCRQFLGVTAGDPSVREAAAYLLGDLPGQSRPNFYYWYYGTLAMYPLQGEAWEKWNQGLQTTLLASQRRTGPLAGSWDPTCVWGCYGGRIYSTALATLSLEVYYRYLPLYVATAPEGSPVR
jgi:hypothetical protein